MSAEGTIVLTDIIGNSGMYQIAILALVFYWTSINGMAAVSVELLAPIVTMRWDWDTPDANGTTFLSTDCKWQDIMNHNSSSEKANASSKLIYKSQYSKRTITEEFGLVCEHSWLVSFANSIFILGCLVGNILCRISEKYGRRRCVVWCTPLMIVSNLCMLFSYGYVMFAVAIFVYGASSTLPSVLLFVEALEIVPVSRIPYNGALGKYGLLFGQTLIVGLAWAVKNWFYLQMFQTVFVGLMPFTLWYMLDSPIWLAVRGKGQEARQNLTKIVKRNRQDPSALEPKIQAWTQQMKIQYQEQSKTERGRWCDLFKNRVITFYTCAASFLLISVNCVFYGLAMNMESFGSGLYEDFTISNAISVATLAVTICILSKTTMRIIMIVCFVSEGLVCIIYPLLYDYPQARTILSVLARSLIAPSMSISFIYVASLFPTSVRVIGSGFSSMMSRLFSIAIPFTKEMGENTVVYVPFILFSVLALVTAVLIKFLPETKGKPLPNTIEELMPKKKTDQVVPVDNS